MQNTNPFTEIGAIVVAVVLAISGVLLLYAGKIDTAFASSMFILAAGLLGITGALKAPSSTQKTQINTLLQGMQELIDLIASHTHPVPPTPPSTPTHPVAPPIPAVAPSPIDPGVSMAAYQTGMVPAVTPGTQP